MREHISKHDIEQIKLAKRDFLDDLIGRNIQYAVIINIGGELNVLIEGMETIANKSPVDLNGGRIMKTCPRCDTELIDYYCPNCCLEF